jgi:hypothetical protein
MNAIIFGGKLTKTSLGKMKTPEWHEKQEIKAFLDTLGPDRCWYFMPLMAGYGKSGVPDIMGSLCGAAFGIEVKRPGKAPTAIQARRMREIARTNGLAWAGTAEDVIPFIKSWLEVRGIVV